MVIREREKFARYVTLAWQQASAPAAAFSRFFYVRIRQITVASHSAFKTETQR
jgi:hypothetical protein